MARFGLSRALASDWREWQELAVRAEHAGLAGLWPADLSNSDCFVDSALALSVTERIPVGIVVALPTRSAAQTAAAASALAGYAPGRMTLGLGAGYGYLNETIHNVPFAPPVPRMREFHAAVTALLRAPAGQPVEFVGEYQRAAGVGYGLDAASLPVILGVHGQAMTRLAARVADGIAIQVITPRGTLADRARLVREIRGDAAAPFQSALGIIASVDQDEGVALRRATAEIVGALSLPRFRPRLAEAAGEESVARFGERIAAGDLPGAAKTLPEAIIRQFAIVATPRSFRDAAEIADADIVIPVSPGLFGLRFAAGLGFGPADVAAGRESLLRVLLE
jgi:alkanesulfonate monooxygenase SsuD/methylene tetrahydromethanopterin reductase-like flavin-dependent oxidoreductase (luciferase family)